MSCSNTLISLTIKVSKLLSLFLINQLISSCGEAPIPTDENPREIQINSMFINIKLEDFSQENSINLMKLADEFEYYSQEEILFRENHRSVVLKFGDLDGSLLGLTECSFYYESNKTNCLITLKNEINPDFSENSLDLTRRETLFFGVVRHEIGHAFGMGHNLVDMSHIMYPIYNSSSVHDQSIILKFITDLTNFRYNGPSSGIRTIFDDRDSSD